MGRVVVEGRRSCYKYRVSVNESVSPANLAVGFHDVSVKKDRVKWDMGVTILVPRINFRIRARLTRAVRDRLDRMLKKATFLRPVRNHTIALLSELYPNHIMVDAHVCVETLVGDEHRGVDQRDKEEFLDMCFGTDMDEPDEDEEGDKDEEGEEEDVEEEYGEEYEVVEDVWAADPPSKDALEALESSYATDEGAQCSVCLEDLCPGSALTKLPCSHSFHPDCILIWLQNQHMCPLCRFTLPHSEEESESESESESS